MARFPKNAIDSDIYCLLTLSSDKTSSSRSGRIMRALTAKKNAYKIYKEEIASCGSAWAQKVTIDLISGDYFQSIVHVWDVNFGVVNINGSI